MAIQGARAPHCPRCGTPAVWHAQPGQWGCDRCQQMLPPIQHAPIATSPWTPFAANQPAGIARPDAPPCPRCSAASVWHPNVQQWGCDRCRLMNPMIQYLVLPSSATSGPGTAVVKVIVSILLIAIAIAVTVSLRVR